MHERTLQSGLLGRLDLTKNTPDNDVAIVKGVSSSKTAEHTEISRVIVVARFHEFRWVVFNDQVVEVGVSVCRRTVRNETESGVRRYADVKQRLVVDKPVHPVVLLHTRVNTRAVSAN